MFHTRVLGLPCRNLDLFLLGERGVLRELSGKEDSDILQETSGGRDDFSSDVLKRNQESAMQESESSSGIGKAEQPLAVIEGVMGFYDGIGGTTEASAYDIARLLGTPVILVVKPRGQSATLAAEICGLMNFRPENHIAGVILNECSAALSDHLRSIIERECGIPVFGYLPKMEEAKVESRHLGLLMADEIPEFRDRFEAIAARMEETVEIDRILACMDFAESVTDQENVLGEEIDRIKMHGADVTSESLAGNVAVSVTDETEEQRLGAVILNANEIEFKDSESNISRRICRIAVARDEAFSFYYASSLDALRRAGAELLPFSPLRDHCLPADISGLYLGGGYPENYAAELSANREMLRDIREAIEKGLPTVAECGGFMYLQEKLEGSDGNVYPMVGALTGEAARTPRLVRFGYVTLTAEADSLLFRAGEPVPAHEFHHWDSTECGDALTARKYDGRNWKCGVVNDRLYAGYPHLELGGDAPLAERFVRACREYAAIECGL
jgi:cobyrinic acid a,c-diamide synthase